MISFKIILGLLFGLLTGALVFLGFISFKKNQVSTDSSYWVRHSHLIIDQTDHISSLFKDIQLESNAFFISGDTSLVRPYVETKNLLMDKVQNLRSLTLSFPDQKSRIDSLEVFLSELMKATDSVILDSPKIVYSEKMLLDRVYSNRVFRSQIRNIIDEIKGDEMELLRKREIANEASMKAFNITFVQLLSVMSLLLVVTFLSIRYNFNKRVRMERELKNANELFVKLFYESPIGIIISRSKDGVILDCNRAYSKLINYDRDEIMGNTVSKLKILKKGNSYLEMIKGADTEGFAKDIEIQLKPKGKAPIWVALSVQPIEVQNESCLLCAFLDIDVHKRAEEEITKALEAEMELSKLKSNFVSMASHEFRTPLTAILSSVFLLEHFSCGENQDKAAKHLSRIKTSVSNLTSILDEFLSLTKIEEGKLKPKFEKLNLKECMEGICQNLRGFAKPGQNIVYHHKGHKEVYTDPVILGNIVNNLVVNAIKYSPENTVIQVSSYANSKLHLTVSDNGIGIPVEDQAHLFGRFFRASNAGTVQGTGLGLHIMKHYVDLLKGSIHLKSELGKGTEFKISFDQKVPDAETLVLVN